MTDTRRYPFSIAAGGMQPITASGARFLIDSTTGPVDIRWDGGFLAGLEAGEGYKIEGGYADLALTNPGASTITGYLLVSDDDYINNRIAGEVSLDGGTNFVNSAPEVTNASTVMLAANANRTYLLVQNNHATATVYLNFSAAATAANGVKLAPGASYESGMAVHVGAINAIGDVASNTAVIVAEG